MSFSKESDLKPLNVSFTGRIIRYIQELESRKIAKLTVMKLAEQLDINRSVLYRKFVKELGITPAAYLVEARKHSVFSNDEPKKLSCQVSSYIEALPPEQLAVLTVGYIAQTFSLSPSYLVRIFKKEKNSSLNQYILRTKIERSAELLRLNLDLKVNDVARSFGFSQTGCYSRLFKQIKGVTPNQYKKVSA